MSGWRKARRSMTTGHCVQAASWRTSSHSFSNGNCVQAGHGPGVVGVRDSTLGDAGLVLVVPPAAWSAFTASLK